MFTSKPEIEECHKSSNHHNLPSLGWVAMSWVVWMVLALVQGALTEQVRNLPSTNVNQTDGRKTADIHGAGYATFYQFVGCFPHYKGVLNATNLMTT